MTFTSIRFFVFLIVSLCVYYLFPKSKRWLVLLTSSLIFYASLDFKAFGYIVLSSLSIYAATYKMSKIDNKYAPILNNETKENKKTIKKQIKSEKKLYLLLSLSLNLSVLFLVKYLPTFTKVTTSLLFNNPIIINIILPLGISFYTFQGIGYLVDAYYGKVAIEKNYFKLLLFFSFFPQIIQGPISKYSQLMPQLLKGNNLEYNNVKFGAQLILWGLLKKLIIADILAPLVATVMGAPQNYNGVLVAVGAFANYIQVYGDFSGGIDITRGISQMYGIDMVLNFSRPFYAENLTDYWRRWHMSLGQFMKDYVMMPLNISKPMIKLGKFSRNKFGIKYGKYIPTLAGTFIVFLLVGIWHGPNLKFLVFGATNGLVVSLETLLLSIKPKKTYTKVTYLLKRFINAIYTFIVVYFISIISMSKDMNVCSQIFVKILTDFKLEYINREILNAANFPLKKFAFVIAVFCVVLFIELIQEFGIKIRVSVSNQFILVRYALYLLLIFTILLFAYNGSAPGGFAYAAF